MLSYAPIGEAYCRFFQGGKGQSGSQQDHGRFPNSVGNRLCWRGIGVAFCSLKMSGSLFHKITDSLSHVKAMLSDSERLPNLWYTHEVLCNSFHCVRYPSEEAS
jgi:hypothetical protein